MYINSPSGTGVLGCEPSKDVSAFANQAFGVSDARNSWNAFAFGHCGSYCKKQLSDSKSALNAWRFPNYEFAYTVCH